MKILAKSKTWAALGIIGLALLLAVGGGWLLVNRERLPVASGPATEIAKGGRLNLSPIASLAANGPVAPTAPPNTATPTTGPTPTLPPLATPTPGVEIVPATATASPEVTALPVAVTSAAPTPSTVAVATRPASIIPYKIKIDAINVDTYVERVGVAKDGTMDVPKNIFNTAWFGEGGFRPGALGNAVIAGHLDAPGVKAVFWDLDKLKPGDKVEVTDFNGQKLTFEVTGSQIYSYNNAPLLDIFGPSAQPRLNLITCIGAFDQSRLSYDKRLVVFSKLA